MKPYSEQDRFKDNVPAQRDEDEVLDYFFSHAYHDMRFFLKSITKYNASEYTFFGDAQKNLYYISDNMRDTFGFESNLVEDLLEKWKSRIHGDMWREMYERDQENMLRDKSELHDLRYQVMDKEGKVFWIRCCGCMQWDKDRTKPLFFAGRVSKQDEHFTVDPVTNFPSNDTLRRHLQERLKNHQHCMTIGFCLNNIAQVNTVHGRNMADRLISYISRQLMDDLGNEMTFYRLPGVRSIALVDGANKESREALMGKIRKIVEEGYDKMGLVVDRPCSFAFMDFPQQGLSPADFQQNMVSLIKIARKERQLPYIEDSEQNIKRVQDQNGMEMTIMQDILNGMQNFRSVIQPVVSTETGKIIGGETLMRWQYEGRDVSPGIFIPILEKDRMIHLAGRWIFEQAVSACSKIVRYLPEFYLTVNISLQQLYDPELLHYIPDLLEKYQLDGRHLVIEMTESCMDKQPAKIHTLMAMCSELGVRLALDDFGTGYSSLRVLMKYPTDIIKLDRSLLLEMTESVDKSNFITSIVFACHQFGKKVCMEGVETDQQRKLVQDAQCDMIQGFYYYRPTELDELYKTVEQLSQEQ